MLLSSTVNATVAAIVVVSASVGVVAAADANADVDALERMFLLATNTRGEQQGILVSVRCLVCGRALIECACLSTRSSCSICTSSSRVRQPSEARATKATQARG